MYTDINNIYALFQNALEMKVELNVSQKFSPSYLSEKYRYTEEKKYLLDLERIVKHFLNPLTRNIDFQDIRKGSQLN